MDSLAMILLLETETCLENHMRPPLTKTALSQ